MWYLQEASATAAKSEQIKDRLTACTIQAYLYIGMYFFLNYIYIYVLVWCFCPGAPRGPTAWRTARPKAGQPGRPWMKPWQANPDQEICRYQFSENIIHYIYECFIQIYHVVFYELPMMYCRRSRSPSCVQWLKWISLWRPDNVAAYMLAYILIRFWIFSPAWAGTSGCYVCWRSKGWWRPHQSTAESPLFQRALTDISIQRNIKLCIYLSIYLSIYLPIFSTLVHFRTHMLQYKIIQYKEMLIL